MKVQKVDIYNFKSIGEKCSVVLNTKSTVFVGMSNVGKSNILEAIRFAFSEDPLDRNHWCSWLVSAHESDLSVEVFFDLEPKDYDRFLPILESRPRQLVLKKYLNGKREFHFYPNSEKKFIENPTEETKEELAGLRRKFRKQARQFAFLIKKGEISLESKASKLFSELADWVDKQKYLNILEKKEVQKAKLREFNQKLIILREELESSDYVNVNLRGIKMAITFLISRSNEKRFKLEYETISLEPFSKQEFNSFVPMLVFIDSDESFEIADKLFFSNLQVGSNHFVNQLLSIGDADIARIKSTDGRVRKSAIDNVNKNLVNNLTRFWKQENIRIELREGFNDFSRNENIDKNLQSEGHGSFLELDVYGAEGHCGSIEQQGPGFRWYLWFVVNHLIKNLKHQDVLLVMDEPGLHLHASAQYDLVERFDETLDNIQILYTTHSPFLINKNYPYRVVLISKGNETDSHRGTNINLKPYHSNNGFPWEPLRSAIGLPAGASLYVGGRNLIVEGITDQIILSALIRCLNKKETKTRYNLNNVSINFGGDDANMVAIAIFCHQEKMDCKILCDTDTSQLKTKKLAKVNFPEDRIFIIGDVVSRKRGMKKCIDIEDLISEEFYHSCFLKCYSELSAFEEKELPQSIAEMKENLKEDENWGRSKYYEMYFKQQLKSSFSKILVAKTFAEKLVNEEFKSIEKHIKDLIKLLDTLWTKPNNWG